MRKIVIFPNPILRKKSEPITVWGKQEVSLLADLKGQLVKSKIGVGLSAPQLGENKAVFIGQKDLFFPCENEECDHKHQVEYAFFVNPVVKKGFGKKNYPLMVSPNQETEEFMEGCLSFPDLYGPVKRFLKIEVNWQEPNKKGELVRKEGIFTGLGAIVFQHELDHLNGVLFVDHLREEKRELYKLDKEGKKTKIDLQTMSG